MINYQSKSLGLKDSSLMKTEANTQNSLNNINDFDSRLKDRHVVDIYIYIYIYIYIDIVTDVPDTSGESKNNIGAAFGGLKNGFTEMSLVYKATQKCTDILSSIAVISLLL